ncbi:hypothetical protein SERLADRAFT_417338 [Serpula lacrymans var. lacrymans S7.9]|uniref:DH domain-containing protein n=1 Tax=Serpula lacrymans var. lacrymans (strain S7.9) TaxID=578457 RepID=F8P5T2_SERL9|nr:uncharacterized protein SERLADRAFT_417338 [Serpula lacrymans var. lacrymans S7.9]EGO21969.1 hypothetical protein SERLADRAFT_417338 [Serpula lacrymans var. lacrymans S7.9]
MTNREDSSHTTAEEEEEELTEYGGSVPQIQVSEPSGEAAVDPLEDIDRSKELHVRSLYPYEGQRAEDLTFGENLILTAYPSKSGGDWWYGALARDGKSGFFPQTYVQVTEKFKAKALYSYAGGNADELPFAEGDELSIVDKSETDWWKAEQGGVVFIVPAAYLEIVEGSRPSNMIKDAVRDNSEAEDDIGHAETDDADDTDDSSDVDFLSAEDDSDSDVDPEATEADQEARETERQKVLEAAGLIVNQDVKPPPGVLRSRSARRPRPAPATPQRASIVSNSSTKELPSLPSVDPSRHLNDAFDRYETFKKTHGSINSRMSVSSIDTTPSSPPKSPAISVAPSLQRDGESRASHFLNFLGRSHTPATDNDKRTIPIISAPILNTPDTPSRESSPAFGSSWASLVDKSALDGIPKSERRRQETIFELITTEADYVRDLQLIVELFYSRLMSVLGEKATTVIFANIEDLLLINTTFLSSLEERQKDCRLYVDQIGDILHKHMSNMDVYLAYCVNQSNAGKVLQSMRDTNPELASNLQTLREDPVARSLDLSSYLLVPMQRMTRYPLLIRQILHYTEVAHDRDDITAALRIAEKILNHINETIRDQEGFERLKEISQNLWIGQGRLDLTAPTRHMGPRKLLKEGILLKAKSGRKLRSFLCSDILVLTDENAKTLYRIPISLSDVLVQDVPGRDDLGFRLVLAYPRGGDTISLRVTSVRDCQTWISAVESASKKCRNVEKRLSMPGSR